MRYGIGIALLALALDAGAGLAQQPDGGTSVPAQARPIEAGQRVRITSVAHGLDKQTGTVIAAGESTLTVERRMARTVEFQQMIVTDTVVLSRRAIDRLEVSRAHGRRTGRGALIGLASGAVLGGIIGAASYKECQPDPDIWLDCLMAPESAGQEAMAGAVVFGLIGAGLGAIVGSGTQWDRWEETQGPGAAVSVRPLSQGGFGVGLQLTF